MPNTPLILLMLVMGYAKPGNNPLQNRHALVVRISEEQVSTQPTVMPMTVENCVVVSTNGHAHLELRRQEFAGRAIASAYELWLDKKELGILRQLLEADALKALPRFIAPPTPLGGLSGWYDVTAEIPQDASLQLIGYFEVTGENRPIGTAEMRAGWSRSAVAMHSLLEWFHALKSDKQWKQISNPKSGICGE